MVFDGGLFWVGWLSAAAPLFTCSANAVTNIWVTQVMFYITVQCNTMQCNAMQDNAMQCNTMQ